jgi:uncharacterized Zn finger protein
MTMGGIIMLEVLVDCPKCYRKAKLEDVLTALSNQNVIYTCPNCHLIIKNIKTSKG